MSSFPPLIEAGMNGKFERVKQLIEEGINIDEQDKVIIISKYILLILGW